MLVAIVGGNLQGVEATYLARKAGWETIVIDKNPEAPASCMCDRFEPVTLSDDTDPRRLLDQVDLILPALENVTVLGILNQWSLDTGIPIAFDREAYAISSSKKRSNAMFCRINIDCPDTWPRCRFPVVVKPDGESGSQGIRVIQSREQMLSEFPDLNALDTMVVQTYLEGPCYSIEIMGSPGQYTPLQVTRLEMDSHHDCKRVCAPSGLPEPQVRQFERTALRIAERIGLKGVMDVEAILHEGRLKTLEIDARLPSQTPIAVFHSTGFNMVEALGRLFLSGKPDGFRAGLDDHVVLEHIKVTHGQIEVCGEHIMTEGGALASRPGLFGAHEMITNYRDGLNEWIATAIYKGKNREEVLGKQRQTYENIRRTA